MSLAFAQSRLQGKAQAAHMGAKPAPAVARAIRSSAARTSSSAMSSSSSSSAVFQASVVASQRPSTRRMARAVRVQAAHKPDNAGKKVAIITGASSGLGLNAAKALAQQGWYVVMACRDYLKAARAAQAQGIPQSSYTIMHLDLAALDSVRQFVDLFHSSGLPLDALVCNAAVYLPTAETPTFTADGFELSVGTNHLGHFLLANLLLDDLKKQAKANPASKPRLVIVGSVTGNTNTLAGNIPPKADLGDLRGLSGPKTEVMIDGGEFNGAKAYKDSKVCNMLTMKEFHRRFHDSTGIVFSSLYPGCIAETGLFRNHVPLFRTLFPPFQKYITKGYVSEVDAGKRLAQVVSDPKTAKSGVYWSWNDNANSFENTLSEEAGDDVKAVKVWEVSEKLVGLKSASGKTLVAA